MEDPSTFINGKKERKHLVGRSFSSSFKKYVIRFMIFFLPDLPTFLPNVPTIWDEQLSAENVDIKDKESAKKVDEE